MLLSRYTNGFPPFKNCFIIWNFKMGLYVFQGDGKQDFQSLYITRTTIVELGE